MNLEDKMFILDSSALIEITQRHFWTRPISNYSTKKNTILPKNIPQECLNFIEQEKKDKFNIPFVEKEFALEELINEFLTYQPRNHLDIINNVYAKLQAFKMSENPNYDPSKHYLTSQDKEIIATAIDISSEGKIPIVCSSDGELIETAQMVANDLNLNISTISPYSTDPKNYFNHLFTTYLATCNVYETLKNSTDFSRFFASLQTLKFEDYKPIIVISNLNQERKNKTDIPIYIVNKKRSIFTDPTNYFEQNKISGTYSQSIPNIIDILHLPFFNKKKQTQTRFKKIKSQNKFKQELEKFKKEVINNSLSHRAFRIREKRLSELKRICLNSTLTSN